MPRRIEPDPELVRRLADVAIALPEALVNAGRPFYKPPWSPTIVGMELSDER